MDEMIRRDQARDAYTRQPAKPVEDTTDTRPDDETVVPLWRKRIRHSRWLTERERRERWPIG